MLTVEKALELPLSDEFKSRLALYPSYWCLGLDQNNKIWIFCPPPLFDSIYTRNILKQVCVDTGPLVDKPSEHYSLEKKKVWEHGDFGLGKHCSRKEKPVYTDTHKVPDSCRNDKCLNDQWYAKGLVTRIKSTKQIVHSEP